MQSQKYWTVKNDTPEIFMEKKNYNSILSTSKYTMAMKRKYSFSFFKIGNYICSDGSMN